VRPCNGQPPEPPGRQRGPVVQQPPPAPSSVRPAFDCQSDEVDTVRRPQPGYPAQSARLSSPALITSAWIGVGAVDLDVCPLRQGKARGRASGCGAAGSEIRLRPPRRRVSEPRWLRRSASRSEQCLSPETVSSTWVFTTIIGVRARSAQRSKNCRHCGRLRRPQRHLEGRRRRTRRHTQSSPRASLQIRR